MPEVDPIVDGKPTEINLDFCHDDASLGKHLTARGVAYVSDNAYPGCHLRDLARGMMRSHLRHVSERNAQIPQARALLKSPAECTDEPDVYPMRLTREFEQFLASLDAGAFHDDLSPINHPVSFGAFIDHAIRDGLSYPSEANMLAIAEEPSSPQIAAVLNQLGLDDVMAREHSIRHPSGHMDLLGSTSGVSRPGNSTIWSKRTSASTRLT